MEYKVKIRIVEIMGEGKCPHGHQVGEEYSYPEDRGKICANAFHTLWPAIRVMQFGGTFPWADEPDRTRLCCSDPKRPVVYEITRTKE